MLFYSFMTNMSEHNFHIIYLELKICSGHLIPYKSDDHEINYKINSHKGTRIFIEAKERDEFEVRKH